MMSLHNFRCSSKPMIDSQRIAPMDAADVAWSLEMHRRRNPQPSLLAKIFGRNAR